MTQAQFFRAVWDASEKVLSETPVRQEVHYGLALKYAVEAGLQKKTPGKTRVQFLKEDPILKAIVASADGDGRTLTRSLFLLMLEAWEHYQKKSAPPKEIPPFEG